jgi:hypothetical protein
MYFAFLAEEAVLRAENAPLRQEVQLLHEKMDLLIRRVFGRSSEKLDADQLDLFLLTAENEPLWRRLTLGTKSEQGAMRARERWPAELPVIEDVIDRKEVQKAPEIWRLIGAEISEQLDYESGRFLR